MQRNRQNKKEDMKDRNNLIVSEKLNKEKYLKTKMMEEYKKQGK